MHVLPMQQKACKAVVQSQDPAKTLTSPEVSRKAFEWYSLWIWESARLTYRLPESR